ncbi:MAG: Omp28-related outer membrane protein [Aureispira sp.]
MKAIFLGTIILLLVSISCEELPPTITPCQTDRVVLVEEFTGIDCVNCPTGAQKLKEISSQNPGKVIIVGIHAGYFAGDHNGFNLNSPDGELLEAQYLGPVSGYPAATINRRLFPGESDIVTAQTKWAGIINSELCERAIVSLDIVSTFDAATNKASITVDVAPSDFYITTVEEDVALTIMITEDDIEGYQKTPNGIDPEYNHEHVLRDVVSVNYSGDVLFSKGTAMEPVQKAVTDYVVPSDWDVENCRVVAFVHHKGGKKDVLQAATKWLKPR